MVMVSATASVLDDERSIGKQRKIVTLDMAAKKESRKEINCDTIRVLIIQDDV
jgi:hypothetical protein